MWHAKETIFVNAEVHQVTVLITLNARLRIQFRSAKTRIWILILESEIEIATEIETDSSSHYVHHLNAMVMSKMGPLNSMHWDFILVTNWFIIAWKPSWPLRRNTKLLVFKKIQEDHKLWVEFWKSLGPFCFFLTGWKLRGSIWGHFCTPGGRCHSLLWEWLQLITTSWLPKNNIK